MLQKLPHFGPYRQQREEILTKFRKAPKLDLNPEDITPIVDNSKLRIQDVIGRSLNQIGAYKQLDNEKQVVALIDDVRFYLIFYKEVTKHTFLCPNHYNAG